MRSVDQHVVAPMSGVSPSHHPHRRCWCNSPQLRIPPRTGPAQPLLTRDSRKKKEKRREEKRREEKRRGEKKREEKRREEKRRRQVERRREENGRASKSKSNPKEGRKEIVRMMCL